MKRFLLTLLVGLATIGADRAQTAYVCQGRVATTLPLEKLIDVKFSADQKQVEINRRSYDVDAIDSISFAEPAFKAFALGADISWTTEMESRGYKFANSQGTQMECTALMRELGLNAIRLRVWVNPSNKFCGKDDVLEKARRAAALDMDIMIDFHYSDTWADPSHQTIPAAWSNHSYSQILTDVADHTREVLQLLKDNGIEPRWVQVGNETSNGLLWNVGRADQNPRQYAGIIDAGCKAAKAVFPKVLTVVHLDNGFDQSLYDWNLGILRTYSVSYDMVGMSLYPMTAAEWHADKVSSADDAIDKCLANIAHVKTAFSKPVLITETGMKVGQPDRGRTLLTTLISKARAEANCRGVMYWEPEAPSGYNGGYDMGAFTASGKVCRPTVIMDAFK